MIQMIRLGTCSFVLSVSGARDEGKSLLPTQKGDNA
jgi:hypothetical protein